MLKANQIPDEVVEAAAKALANNADLNWDDVPYAHNVMRGEARAAITAALNAWPKADQYLGAVVLPLPQDARDE